MASLQNRSPLVVTVARKPALKREFRYDRPEEADAYMAQLKAQADAAGKTLEMKLSQLDTAWEVRIRQRGYKPVNITAGSLKDAEKLVQKVESDRAQGLVIDYTKAHHVTFAELMLMHIAKHKRPKTFSHDFYKVAAWLRSSGPRGETLLAAFVAEHEAARQAEQKAENRGEKRPARKPLPQLKFRIAGQMANLEWIHKKFAHVEAEDINAYVEARVHQVGKATVDREIDVFRLIVNRATKSWGYRVAFDPIEGVERPKYNNQRDRRLRAGEEESLVEAARREDRERAVSEMVEQWVSDEFGSTAFSSNSAKKKVLAARRAELLLMAEQQVQRDAANGLLPTPWVEAYLQFQLMGGTRRSESGNLKWCDVDVEEKTALLYDTKNGSNRKAPMRAELLDLLSRLPRDTEEVFPFGVKWLSNAWKRMCQHAGIVGLRIHDLRHEAVSRVAETGEFNLLELSEYSGHQDLTMLQRYAHLRTTRLAHKLDEAFANEELHRTHKGRKFLTKKGRELCREAQDDTGTDESQSLSAPPVAHANAALPQYNFGLQWPVTGTFTVAFGP